MNQSAVSSQKSAVGADGVLSLARLFRLRLQKNRFVVHHGITSNFAYCTANRGKSQLKIRKAA